MEGRRALAAIVAATAPLACMAQGALKLVNMDTGSILAPGKTSLKLEGRFFGGNESNSYGTLEFDLGLQPEWGFGLRSSFGKVKGFAGPGFLIRYGGTDVEGFVRYKPATLMGLSLQGGLSVPNTPAQDQAFATAAINYELPLQNTQGAAFYVGTRGVFREGSNLIGIGGGFSASLGMGLDLVGDFTGIVTGQNTYSTTTGQRIRTAIYGVGLRYQTPSAGLYDISWNAGVTNGYGGTTGFSLTPGLGSSVAFYAGLSVRF